MRDSAPTGHGWGTPPSAARHALLRVEPEAYALALAERADIGGESILADWAALQRPLIGRRRGPCDRDGLTPAGIPLPPSHGKKRIALQIEPAAVIAVEPPPSLAACADDAPDTWRATIDDILSLSFEACIEARVFGALAWTRLTGLQYLSASSDLDLIFVVTPDTDVPTLVEALARIDATAPMRLDGEVVRLDAGWAVNWRELYGGADEVLVKTVDSVALQPRAALFPGGPLSEPRSWRSAS